MAAIKEYMFYAVKNYKNTVNTKYFQTGERTPGATVLHPPLVIPELHGLDQWLWLYFLDLKQLELLFLDWTDKSSLFLTWMNAEKKKK